MKLQASASSGMTNVSANFVGHLDLKLDGALVKRLKKTQDYLRLAGKQAETNLLFLPSPGLRT